MLTYDISGNKKYYTLYRLIRGDILSGKIRAGEKLPSKRALAENLSVSVTTVQTAYDQLAAEGYIESRERSGYFVSEASVGDLGAKDRAEYAPPAEKVKFKYDLVKGYTPAEHFPFSVWAKLMRGVLSDCGEHLLERVPCDGDWQLKSAISAYLYRARGVDVDPCRVVIGAGAEHLYGVIVQLLGRDKVFAVENPGYGKIYSTYGLYGAKCTPVAVTRAGADYEGVEKSGADVLHISPSHQFPTGAVMPATARAKLIGWAISRQKYIVEDDYDSEFRLFGKPLPCLFGLCPDRVIYINTFSKSLAPSMRMGYMVLPLELYKRYLTLFGNSANVVPLFEQKTLAAMIDGGHFERHLNRLKNRFRGVRAAILNKVKELNLPCTVEDTGSGPHMVLAFDKSFTEEQIKARAAASGINIRCLTDYLIAPLSGYENRVVVNYSGLTEKEVQKFMLN